MVLNESFPRNIDCFPKKPDLVWVGHKHLGKLIDIGYVGEICVYIYDTVII